MRLSARLPARRLAVATTALALVAAGTAVVTPAAAAVADMAHGARRGPSHSHVPSLARLAQARTAHARAAALSPRATGPTAGDPYAVSASSTVGLTYTDLATRATGTFSQAGATASQPDLEDQVPSTSVDGTKITYSYANQADKDTLTAGIAVFTVGNPAARTALTSSSYNATKGTGTFDFDPAVSRDGSTIYFDREVDPADGSASTIDVYSIPTAGGTPTLVQSAASNPSFDGSGNLVYLDQSTLPASGPASDTCLVLRRAPSATTSTCILTYGQAAAAVPGPPPLNMIFAVDLRASRSSEQTAFAVNFMNGTANRSILGVITPGASRPFATLAATYVVGTDVIEGQADIDPTGTEVTFDRVLLDADGVPTTGAINAVDTATGLHRAVVAGQADQGATTYIPAATNAAASGYVPLTQPTRVLDTRTGTGAPRARLTTAPIDVQITGGTSGVPTGATAVVLNLTGIAPTGYTNIRVFPTPTTAVPTPVVSNVNIDPGKTAANAVTVALPASGKIRVQNAAGTVDAAADVVGYYTPVAAGGSLFTSLATPVRALDTRNGTGGVPAAPLPAGGYLDLPVRGHSGVPADATSVVVNAGALAGQSQTFVSVYPTPATSGNTMPTTSTLNLAAGQTRANLATVTIGTGGAIRFYNNLGSTNVFADVVGYYAPAASGGSAFVPLVPSRIFDTRDGTKVTYGVAGPVGQQARATAPAAGQLTTGFGINAVPVNASAVQVNVTAVLPTALTFLSLSASPGPSGTPSFSTLNAAARETVANAAVVTLGTGLQVTTYNNRGNTGVLLDLAGYFVPQLR